MKKKKKKKQKVYLLVYADATEVTVEKVTAEEMGERIRYLELDDDEFTMIDGKIIKRC